MAAFLGGLQSPIRKSRRRLTPGWRHLVHPGRRLALLVMCLGMACSGCAWRASPALERSPETSMRALAEKRGFFIGAAMELRILAHDPLYGETLAREFNMLTPENAMKFGRLCPEGRGIYDFTAVDGMMDFAQRHRIAVRGHTLVRKSMNPRWLTRGTWTREELAEILEQHITTVLGRYRGKMAAWDVVNEAISDNPEETWSGSIWWDEAIQTDFIDRAFHWAHAADSEALLFYNDYGIGQGGRKFEKVIELVEGIIRRGVPIHGVGFQMHIEESAPFRPRRLSESIQQIRDLGLVVQITEMDVAIALPVTPKKLRRQARIYGEVLRIALAHPSCSALVTWGFTDRHSWIPAFSKGRSGGALLFDESYQPKPAYWEMMKALQKMHDARRAK